MRRELLTARVGWQQQMESLGFGYHSIDGVYWDESRCYAFTAEEIDSLEAATSTLHQCALDAARHVIEKGRTREFGIAPEWVPLIERSFAAFERSECAGFTLFGRMDLNYDGTGPAKLLEYNADTPTACLEASVAQWHWLQAVRPQADQFNSIHEKLIEAWTRLKACSASERLHFAAVSEEDSPEDWGNLEYLRDTAIQAGWSTVALPIDQIGHAGIDFVDQDSQPIESLFKLYPWEWMAREEFAVHVPASHVQFIEPAWKMLLSNKALLVILWELFPDHPNLLPAYYDPARLGTRYACKPKLAREGANVTLVDGARVERSEGPYDAHDCVFQALAPLPCFGDDHVSVGSWIVNGEPAGIGLREDESAITRNTSRFVPHYLV
ncbi:MAG TPA: glutathionylspermidine synthase family protein [Burkholderiaceae bacterium]|jgi:glutathionylspermidine synthase|nr:glutathionylspermidine synthase family protein [Burkholderiaceae bacterium]